METWDLYDRNRQLTKAKAVRGEKVPASYYHIVVHICFFDDNGRMLIQHRQPFKEGWSNRWDIGVGGSAIEGETTQEAAQRETGEEIGYYYDFSSAMPALTINHGCAYDDYYVINKNIDISSLTPQPEEVSEVKWATNDEIDDMLDKNEFVPYSKKLISLLFEIHEKKSI